MRFPTPTLTAMLITAALALPAMAESPAPGRITITGEGRVEAAPDIATIMVGVSTSATTATEAMAGNSDSMARVLDRLKAAGLAARDLQTSGLNLGPRMDYSRDGQPPRLVGYDASNTLMVRVRDLGALGGILDTVVSDGANTLNGLTFGLSDPEPLRDAARVRAVEEARRKAEMIAGAAGVRLGRVVELSEQANRINPGMMMRDSMVAASPVPIAEGEVSYSVAVTITWELAQD